MKTLPDDSKKRGEYPVSSGCLAYFPAALAGVARHSYLGGAKYNDGALVHLRYISTQHLDCIGRHILDLQDLLAALERGVFVVKAWVYNLEKKEEEYIEIPIQEAIIIEANALAWRSLATSQELHEKLLDAPLAPAARTKPNSHSIEILSFPTDRRVEFVKLLRHLMDWGLKEAIDFSKSPMPRTLTVPNKWSIQDIRATFTKIGVEVR